MMSAAAPIPQGAYHMSGPIAQGLPRAALSGGMTARKMSVQLESMPANRVPPTPAKDTRERVIVKAILEQQPDGRWKADSAIIDLLGIKDVVTRAMGILSIHESLTELKVRFLNEPYIFC